MYKTKYYERFKELYKDKKYALAYAMSIKFPYIQQTPEYVNMEKNFQTSFENAQKLILLNLPIKAKDQIAKYITVISKRNILQLVINNTSNFRNFLFAYDNNDFKTCYEIIDKDKNIKLLKISILLERHWINIMDKCKVFAKEGNISSIKEVLGDLILIKSRVEEIGSLLRISFHIKIQQLLDTKDFYQAENIIYSYIDIFGIDKEIKELMVIFEKVSYTILAITHQNKKILKNSWIDSEITMCFDS